MDQSSSELALSLQALFLKFWQSEWRLIAIIVAAPLIQVLIEFISPFFVKHFLNLSGRKKDKQVNQKRARTLSRVITATSLVLISLTVLWALLAEFNINMVPIITGAGILSLAVGFGAQSLIKDIISGIFIVSENQYNQGDWIKVGDFEGRVTDINLRRTILQTPQGARHIVPNGEIKVVTNNTNQYNAISLDIPTKVDDKFDQVNRIIDDVGQKLAKDPKFKDYILEPPAAIGVNEINEYAAVIRVWGKAKPGKQVVVKRELAERIIKEFSHRGIKLPGKIMK